MKYLPLLWSALRRRRVRSIFTLLSITVAFLLVGVMTGVDARFRDMIDNIPANRITVIARFGGGLPLAYLDQIARVDGVTHLAPFGNLFGYYREDTPQNFLGMTMSDERISAVWPEMNIPPEIHAELKQVQNGVVISQVIADRLGWKKGDSVSLQTARLAQNGSRAWTFRVLAILPDVESEPTGFTLGNFTYLNEARADGQKNFVNAFGLVIADSARANEASAAIERLFSNSSAPVSAMPQRTLLENGLRAVVDMKFLSYSVSAAALFMILFLTGNVMARSVSERIPEFATMKAIGFSDVSIFTLVLAETAVLCLVGAGLGLLAAEAVPSVIASTLPNVPMPIITPWVVGFSLVAAIFVASVSGLPAAWRVKQLRIAEALAGR